MRVWDETDKKENTVPDGAGNFFMGYDNNYKLTTYTVKNLKPGHKYRFWVHSGTINQPSPETVVYFSVKPAVTKAFVPPTNLKATLNGKNVMLSWDDVSKYGYLVRAVKMVNGAPDLKNKKYPQGSQDDQQPVTSNQVVYQIDSKNMKALQPGETYLFWVHTCAENCKTFTKDTRVTLTVPR
jgi:hypothetical protein